MTSQPIRAIYEDGVLKPLDPVELNEHETVYITIETPPPTPATDALAGWQAVYEGLDEGEIAQVEQIALNRDTFMPGAPE